MTATRAALLGGGYGGASGGVVGGGIAQMFFGYDTHVLPLWVAAFIARSSQGFSVRWRPAAAYASRRAWAPAKILPTLEINAQVRRPPSGRKTTNESESNEDNKEMHQMRFK